jgi:hypothetical protein
VCLCVCVCATRGSAAPPASNEKCVALYSYSSSCIHSPITYILQLSTTTINNNITTTNNNNNNSPPPSLQCPTFADPLGGLGCEAARDCSGRGLCDYDTGRCSCFGGFVGSGCQAVDEARGLR